MDQSGPRPVIAIVGAGIAGLAAAFFLRDQPANVIVLDGAPRPGGKLAGAEVAGVQLDVGAEALLTRRPEGTGLIEAAGLGGELVPAGTTAARIWSRGEMRPLPARQFMGVPADAAALAGTGLLSAAGLARARQEPDLPATHRDGDVPVASYVAARFGQEVVDRLVDPLLGGVYAGRSEELSFDATLPALAAAARRTSTLTAAATTLLPPPGPADQANGAAASAPRPPVFSSLAGGLGTLPPALAAASGAQLRTGAMVRELVAAGASDSRWLAADYRLRARPAVAGRGRGHPGPARPAGQPAAGRGARRRRRGGRAGRDQLRQHGHRHAGVPARGVPAAA